MYVCMYVCVRRYVRTVISPKADWIFIRCWHQMCIPTHPCTCIYLHMHTQSHTHKYTYSTPHITTTRTKPGVEWGRVASSFPPPYCTQPGNDEVHYLAKVGSTNLICFHCPQADSKNLISLYPGGRKVSTIKIWW
jgi:hypothetical protein